MGSSRPFPVAIPHTPLLLVCLVVTLSLPTAHQQRLKMSTISASPEVLPFPQAPSSSPGLSPDISPLYPTPAGSKLTPSPMESSLPIIPSSPSPPNPDASPDPDANAAVSPSHSLPESSARALHPPFGSPLFALLLLLAAVHILPHLIVLW